MDISQLMPLFMNQGGQNNQNMNQGGQNNQNMQNMFSSLLNQNGGCTQNNMMQMLMPMFQNQSMCNRPQPAKKPRPDCCPNAVNYELYTILNQINK